MITLSGSPLSREVYRARLLLDLAGLPYEKGEGRDLRIDAHGEVFDDAWRALSRLAPPDWQADGRWFAFARRLAASPASVALFRELDEHLWFGEQAGEPWLCGDRPSIADIGCFPEVMMSEQAGLSRLPYPALRRWADRLRRLPGFTVMPGIYTLPGSI
jgi:glutathione S-transferase